MLDFDIPRGPLVLQTADRTGIDRLVRVYLFSTRFGEAVRSTCLGLTVLDATGRAVPVRWDDEVDPARVRFWTAPPFRLSDSDRYVLGGWKRVGDRREAAAYIRDLYAVAKGWWDATYHREWFGPIE